MTGIIRQMNDREHSTDKLTTDELIDLAVQIRRWGQALGFQQVGITDVSLEQAENHLQHWLSMNHHGEME